MSCLIIIKIFVANAWNENHLVYLWHPYRYHTWRNVLLLHFQQPQSILNIYSQVDLMHIFISWGVRFEQMLQLMQRFHSDVPVPFHWLIIKCCPPGQYQQHALVAASLSWPHQVTCGSSVFYFILCNSPVSINIQSWQSCSHVIKLHGKAKNKGNSWVAFIEN